jgi:HlyD family secretion protein
VKLKKYIFLGAVLILLVGGYKLIGLGGTSRDIPTSRVAKGEFVVSLSENGSLAAKRSVTISAPRIRGNLLIVKLAQEGTMVKAGDFLVQFDPTEQETKLRDAQAELKIAEANLDRAIAQYDMDSKQYELDLRKAERAAAEKQAESPMIRTEAGMELDLAKVKFEQQKKMLEADIEKQKVEVGKARDKKDQADRDLKSMTLTAPIPGLVVYLEIWKGGNMSKLQEGDAPWSGQGLLDLPDLSTMIVKTTVSEVDISKIKKDQKAEIRLDAVPGPVFAGKVSDIGTLAHEKERGSQINVFDIEVQLDSTDSRIKPGMSAKADIIIDRFGDALSVPIEAVFDRDDTTVVYTKSGKKIPVQLGVRNDRSVIVTSGLKDGDEISLTDPTRKAEDQTSPKDEAPDAKEKSGRKTTTTTVIIGG